MIKQIPRGKLGELKVWADSGWLCSHVKKIKDDEIRANYLMTLGLTLFETDIRDSGTVSLIAEKGKWRIDDYAYGGPKYPMTRSAVRAFLLPHAEKFQKGRFPPDVDVDIIVKIILDEPHEVVFVPQFEKVETLKLLYQSIRKQAATGDDLFFGGLNPFSDASKLLASKTIPEFVSRLSEQAKSSPGSASDILLNQFLGGEKFIASIKAEPAEEISSALRC